MMEELSRKVNRVDFPEWGNECKCYPFASDMKWLTVSEFDNCAHVRLFGS